LCWPKRVGCRVQGRSQNRFNKLGDVGGDAPGLVAGERLNKRTPSGETAWGPEVLQFRLWAEQRGVSGGDGEPPGHA
jgi:hypothetical protein